MKEIWHVVRFKGELAIDFSPFPTTESEAQQIADVGNSKGDGYSYKLANVEELSIFNFQ